MASAAVSGDSTMSRALALALEAGRHVDGGAEVIQPVVEGDGDGRAAMHAELDDDRRARPSSTWLSRLKAAIWRWMSMAAATAWRGDDERRHHRVADGLHDRALMLADRPWP